MELEFIDAKIPTFELCFQKRFIQSVKFECKTLESKSR